MTIRSAKPSVRLGGLLAVSLLTVGALAGCAGGASERDRAQARVTAKEKAVADAEASLATASAAFCDGAETYVLALDRYGDVLRSTAPTVGDVTAAGTDLQEPQEDVATSADAAVEAQLSLTAAQQELADAQAQLARVEASGAPVAESSPVPTPEPLASSASVERVKQAQSDLDATRAGITEQTPLTDASEQFNAAVVSLEWAWLALFTDAGCPSDEQALQTQAAVTAYVTALQLDLATAGHYAGTIDGIYGPETVAAVEALQTANGLPVTGTVDSATADALHTSLLVIDGATQQAELATTAAVQQTLALAGFWDGPVDGVWTPELTEAVKDFQIELGVEPTGTVDAATITAFEAALAELMAPTPEPSASPTP
ncbi:hypothetical protein GCM10009775_32710 [Microbacterium aoyamense]|uniref:Peptidoglycan binding-like domain-containing protein n=1 Tax=Microbacterium aoyamense TaxID=344166 RepID=A0ABN2PXW8_9MICO|nr:peptidoglycan-binding domain-containing protein [Microbacterium aoyamense]